MTRFLLCLAAVALAALATVAAASEKTPAQQALMQRAIKECGSQKYPSGAHPVVNYTRMTFTCVELGSSRR